MLGIKREARGQTQDAEFLALYNALRATEADNEMLSESVEDLQRAVDEMGWAPLFGPYSDADESGLRLDAIRKLLTQTRSLVAGNPLVRKGVNSRTGIIWGEGITVTGNRTKEILALNDKLVFSPAARQELESALATDGNILFLLDRRTKKIIRVPLSQVADFIISPEDGESIQFVKRSWTVRGMSTDGSIETKRKELWYPTIEFVDANPGGIPTSIAGVLVEQDQAFNVVSVNKQIGWLWGVPDLLSVLFWARAYKEFLEAEYTLVRALARFAWKATDTRAKGQGAKKAAIKIAKPGQGIDAGGTVTTPGGMDFVAINKAGANVNFDAGRPLAAMVAAGLEVPLSILLAEPKQSTNNYEISLDPSTVKMGQARQLLWADELTRMFVYLGASKAKVQFPPIQSAPIHRVIQSFVTAASSGIMWPDEVRELIVKALMDFGLTPKGTLPPPEAWQAYVNTAQQNPGTTPQDTPDSSDPTGRSPAGPLADNDHEQRPSE